MPCDASTVRSAALMKYNLRSVKAELTMRKAYGFKTFENIQIALFQKLGKLPKPKSTHKSC